MSFWGLRERKPSAPVIGANIRIRLGAFGPPGNPIQALLDVDPNCGCSGIYSYHEGDIFTPGAQNFVFEPNFELPLQTVWGFGFIRNPNTFNPLQPTQLYSNPQVKQVGLGGLIAGQIALQPLRPNYSEG